MRYALWCQGYVEMIEDILWSTMKLVSPFLEVKCTFYGFYKCTLCTCAEIIGHIELTMEPSEKPSHKPSDEPSDNSMDTSPK
jgi:hypothetical protein